MDVFRLFTAIMAMIISPVYQSVIAVSGSGNCEELPTIKNSGNNITGIQYGHSEGTAVQFHCLQEYRPVGNGLYICSNSTWVGGNFSCLIKTCPKLGSPKHGKKIGGNYEIGSVMRYKCEVGFEMIGSVTSLCKLNSQWDPPNVPECRIKKCLAVPVIEHGGFISENKTEGYYVYGTTMRAQCNSGYMVNGPVRIYCDTKGKWTQIPKCRPISCPSYPGLDAKCVRKTTFADNTLLIITCTVNSTLISSRDGTALCENNTWDDLTIRCLCDCEIEADTDLVHIEHLNPNGLLKHNETLNWSCKKGATKTINDSVTCIDGSIKPQGWGCFIPSLTSDDPVDGAGTGAIDKSRNENNDDKLASWQIVLIVVGVGLLAIMLASVMVYLKCRRGTILKDEEELDHQARNALTDSEAGPDGATATVQKKTEHEDRSTETESNRLTTNPLKENEITEDCADEPEKWESVSIEYNKYTKSQFSHNHEERPEEVQSQYNNEALFPSQCNGAATVLLSKDDRAQAKKGMSQHLSEPFTNAISEISEEDSQCESSLSSQEEQELLLTPTPTAQKNITGDPLSDSVAASLEGRDMCPGCGRAVTTMDKPFCGKRYHKECLKCGTS